jgi:hypothetical protein
MTYAKHQIAALLAGITPGEWTADFGHRGPAEWDNHRDPHIYAETDDHLRYICQTTYDMQSHSQSHNVVADTLFIAAAPAIVAQQHARIAALEAALTLIMDDTDSLSVYLSADANEAHFERLHTIARDALEGGDA